MSKYPTTNTVYHSKNVVSKTKISVSFINHINNNISIRYNDYEYNIKTQFFTVQYQT